MINCSKCNKPITSLIRLFIDSDKNQQVCPDCWKKEYNKNFTRGTTVKKVLKMMKILSRKIS